MDFDGMVLLEGGKSPVRDPEAETQMVQHSGAFYKTVMSYFQRRSKMATVLFLLLAMFISVGHVLLPGVYRETKRNNSAAFFRPAKLLPTNTTAFQITDPVANAQLFVSLVYLVCSFPAVFFLGVLLQGAILHYADLRSKMARIIDMTNPRAANAHNFEYFLPLDKPVNVEFWILLRDAAKRRVDPSVNTVVGAALILYVLLVGCIFIRVVILKSALFDLFNSIALYDVLALSFYLIQLFLVLAALNTKVRVSTLECLESAKFAIATEINKVKLLLTNEEKLALDARWKDKRRRHAYSLEESKAVSEYKGVYDALESDYQILESALSWMRVVDTPIDVLGITVDWAFLAKVISLLGAAVGPAILQTLSNINK